MEDDSQGDAANPLRPLARPHAIHPHTTELRRALPRTAPPGIWYSKPPESPPVSCAMLFLHPGPAATPGNPRFTAGISGPDFLN